MKASASIEDVGRMVLPKAIREAMGVFGRGSVILEPPRAVSWAGHFTMPSTLKPLEKWDVQK